MKTDLVNCSFDEYCNFKLPLKFVTSKYDCINRVGQALKEIAYSYCKFQPLSVMDSNENNSMYFEDHEECFKQFVTYIFISQQLYFLKFLKFNCF